MRACIAIGAVAVAMVLAPDIAHGQPVSRDSACAHPPAAPDSVHVVVTAVAKVDSTLGGNTPDLSADFLMYVVDAVRSHFKAPEHMQLTALGWGMPHPISTWLRQDPLRGDRAAQLSDRPMSPVFVNASQRMAGVADAMFVDARFTLDAHGPPREISVGRSSMNAALEASVANAIAAVVPEDYGIIPPRADRARIQLILVAVPFDSTITQPFFATWIPVFHPESFAAPGQAVSPVYPTAGRQAMIDDTVSTRFVIAGDGHAIPESVDFTRVHYRDFAEAVLPALLKSTYRPAVVDGCSMPMLVQQDFIFTIRR